MFVFLVACDCYIALPHGATGLSEFVIVVCPGHTQLLFLMYIHTYAGYIYIYMFSAK